MSERRYDTPPKNKASLEQRLRNLISDDVLQLRARRQIGYIAVIAALGAHARDENGEPIFAVKGGVAVELLIGQEARATKDLDSAVRAQASRSSPCSETPWPVAGTASASGCSHGSRSTTPPGAARSSCSSRASRSPRCSSRLRRPKATQAAARSWSTIRS